MELQEYALRDIGALKYNPGFLLLLDQLQCRFDDLTEELAEPEMSSDAAHNKLRYWQAFREILNTLKNTPESYNYQVAGEPQEDKEAPVDPRIWQQLQAARHFYQESQVE